MKLFIDNTKNLCVLSQCCQGDNDGDMKWILLSADLLFIHSHHTSLNY